MLTVMMNTNGNGWWLGLVSLFGVQMYFPSILIIFPKSESAKPSIFRSASCHQMISLSKYNMLSSTADSGSSASNLVSPLPLYRWWWLCWWWTWWWSRVCWSWRWSWRWNDHRHQNTKCCVFRKPFTGSCFDDSTSLLRLTSTWPVCDDYERVANDDIKVYVSVFVCGNVLCVFECGFIRKSSFSLQTLVSPIQYKISQDRTFELEKTSTERTFHILSSLIWWAIHLNPTKNNSKFNSCEENCLYH